MGHVNGGDDRAAAEFVWKVHAYTNEYIRFADQKAALALAAESGLIAALYGAKVHQACSPSRLNWAAATWPDTVTGVAACIAFALLLIGATSAVLAIAPRLWIEFASSLRSRVLGRLLGDVPRGPIFWKQVVRHENADAYADYVLGLDNRQRDRAVALHIHALAAVADRKYGWVSLSLAFGAAGGVIALCLLLFS